MLRICLRPSKLLMIWILSLSCIAGLAVWYSVLPVWACVVIDLGLAVYAKTQVGKNYFAVGLRYLSCRQGQWLLESEGNQLPLELAGEFYMSRWLTILNFCTNDHKNHVMVIFPDSVDQDDNRRLRVFLKHSLNHAIP